MAKIKFIVIGWVLFLANPAHAGLYYSDETYAELPAQWRGFLLDQRTLRNIAVKGTAQTPESPARTHYRAEAAKLEKKPNRTADETADLGALYVRLGETGKAIALLRPAQRTFPNHFQIAANLGTAWQLNGDLQQAVTCLEQSVRLAPGKFLQAEEYHLKLVRSRLKKTDGLDDLFGIRFVGDKGEYEPGRLAEAEKKKLPAKAVAVAQQLALWLPGDPKLLWQLAELANAYGDTRNAAAHDGRLRHAVRPQPSRLAPPSPAVRAAADQVPLLAADAKAPHEIKHTGTLAFRSKRPLVSHIDSLALPPIIPDGVNFLPWDLFNETSLDNKFRPTFPKYLEGTGRQTSQPQRLHTASGRRHRLDAAFLFVESPIGCWYCEMPETTGIVYVELPAGKSVAFQRGLGAHCRPADFECQ